MLFLQSNASTAQTTILGIFRNTSLFTNTNFPRTLPPHNTSVSPWSFLGLPKLLPLLSLNSKVNRLQLLPHYGNCFTTIQSLYVSAGVSTYSAFFANLGLGNIRPRTPALTLQPTKSGRRGAASIYGASTTSASRLWLSHYDDSAVCDVLTRFLESIFRNRVALRLARSYSVALTSSETYRLLLFRARMSQWLGLGGSSPTWQYAATALYIFFKLADSQVLTAWLHSKLRHMSLFGHGRFLSMFFFTMGIFFLLEGQHYGITGIRCRVAGKISVAGNARKRKLLFNRGRTSSAGVNTKVSSSFYLVRTSTGCLGLTIWLFYE